MKDCLVTDRITGPCSIPPHHVTDRAHVVGMDVYCLEHCPVHNYTFEEPQSGEVVGVQEELFKGISDD